MMIHGLLASDTARAQAARRLSARHRLGASVRVNSAVVAATAGIVGFLGGLVVSMDRLWSEGHTRGACLALEIAENYGAVTSPQKQQALRALSTTPSTESGLFPKSPAAFDAACRRAWASAAWFGR